MDVIESFKSLMDYIVVPLALAIWWGIKKHVLRLEKLEDRTVQAEKAIAVMECQLSDIRRDIDEIKLGIQKLLEKLCR